MSQLQRRPSEANLQDYLEDAQDIADDILGTSANIRKISVIQKPATPNAQSKGHFFTRSVRQVKIS